MAHTRQSGIRTMRAHGRRAELLDDSPAGTVGPCRHLVGDAGHLTNQPNVVP
ncbi:hypothetical protein [Roseicella frigidaeris]|uniref:hypothetical protein n=1 Tax=Roseicella frigidaeris TaxID=2230885 RepID=UPI001401BF8A|nr:hypothetical protein [Roseicella frigidaeris]